MATIHSTHVHAEDQTDEPLVTYEIAPDVYLMVWASRERGQVYLTIDGTNMHI